MRNSYIEAARRVVYFLPNKPSLPFIYDQGPWWCIVHHSMQAVSALLLELSYACFKSQNGMILIQCTRKVCRWLQSMHDPMAQRAWHVVENLIPALAKQWPLDVLETPEQYLLHTKQMQKSLADDRQPTRRLLSIQQLLQWKAFACTSVDRFGKFRHALTP